MNGTFSRQTYAADLEQAPAMQTQNTSLATATPKKRVHVAPLLGHMAQAPSATLPSTRGWPLQPDLEHGNPVELGQTSNMQPTEPLGRTGPALLPAARSENA